MSTRLSLLAFLAVALTACNPSEAPRPAAPADPAAAPAAQSSEPLRAEEDIRDAVQEALNGPHRSEANRARDPYRNPVETLAFFGLEADDTVVELWPGGGWYTEVLAPVLREDGLLVVANFPTDPDAGMIARFGQALLDKLEAEPEVYDRVEVVTFAPPEHPGLGNAASADFVLISRHFHNLIGQDIHDDVLTAAFDVLKPGGTLGVIQHRLPVDRAFDPEVRTGYVPEAFIVAAAEEAGFTLEARSEINANPMDTADYEGGVWTLPPMLRACAEIEDEVELRDCRERYQAIGESDRMTLKFVKP